MLLATSRSIIIFIDQCHQYKFMININFLIFVQIFNLYLSEKKEIDDARIRERI